MTFPATLWLRPSCSLHYCTGSGAGGVTTASVEGHWPGCRIRHISSEAKIWCAMQLTATCLNKMYCKWHRKPAPEPSQHALGRAKSFVTLECLFVFVFISNIKVRSVQSSADNDSIIIVHMLSFGQNRTWFVKQSTVKTPDKCRGGGEEKFEELLILSTGQPKLPSLAEPIVLIVTSLHGNVVHSRLIRLVIKERTGVNKMNWTGVEIGGWQEGKGRRSRRKRKKYSNLSLSFFLKDV